MLDALKSLLSGNQTDTHDALGPRDRRLAEAALMFHVIMADGVVDEAEKNRMSDILRTQFDLGEAEMAELYDMAREAEHEAVDLFRFTNLLKYKLDRDERIAMVERLWELVFADGHMHELEDNVIWRIAKLLEVENIDRIAMKQRVRSRRGL